ncbi:MAG: ADP-ribosylglycohydrolase family protein [Actinomycetota bacterium]
MKATTPEVLRPRFRGCLMGVAVGDALGAPFEGGLAVTPEGWRRVAEGDERLRFTDDTHMTFGVAESLLANLGFDGAHMAETFVRDFDAEPWRGYGPGPPQVFDRLKQGAAWDEAGRSLFGGRGSFGNGAAMRVAPVGLFFFRDFDEVTDVARRTASITHAHELGMEGAAAQACAVALALRSDADIDARRFIDSLLEQVGVPEMTDAIARVGAVVDHPSPDVVARTIGNGIEAVEAVPAALAAFLARPESFADAVGFAISLGGDTDTIGSMTGALSGALLGEDAIPRLWRGRVEGAPSMARVADGLFAAVAERKS